MLFTKKELFDMLGNTLGIKAEAKELEDNIRYIVYTDKLIYNTKELEKEKKENAGNQN